MADVSISPPDPSRLRGGDEGERLRDADRGQLLLIAGLVMAVSLVALVVLLNATIYSENVATRGVEAADGEALEVRAAAVEGTGTLIDATNRNDPGGYGEAEGAVLDGVGELDRQIAAGYARRGGIAGVEPQNGTLREGRFLSGPVNSSTAVSNVVRARGVALNVATADLASANASTANDEAFHVVFNRTTSNTTHEVYVYEDVDNGDLVVANGTNGTELNERCRRPTVDGNRALVDLTEGRFGGEPCPGLWPEPLIDPNGGYAIEFANADSVDVELTATVLSTTAPTGGTALNATSAVYDAVIDIRYRTAELRFETSVRVAPGEPDA
ncbi:DUF7261 family protein [Halorubrum sp. DTA46]|uniref:DUF7261 family protein n=1 Tax=Halorubrum sp. DTA46 TaxID=3402162 RepID=UPI003AAAEEB7